MSVQVTFLKNICTGIPIPTCEFPPSTACADISLIHDHDFFKLTIILPPQQLAFASHR